MEIWALYAFIGMLFSGTFAFMQKISAERNYSPTIVACSVLISQVVISSLFWWYEGFPLIDWKIMTYLGIILGFLNLAVYILRIQALKHIDTAIYFPIYKAIGPTLVTFAGIYFFQEHLSRFEIIGIILGITVPLLLIHTSEKGRQKNLAKGLMILLITVLIAALSAILQKVAADNEASIFFFLIVTALVGIFTTLIILATSRKKDTSHDLKNWPVYKFGLYAGIIETVAMILLMKALEGSLAITYTINSFYILVPIILSIIIYKEHINARKGLAIGLSLFAIILFQL